MKIICFALLLAPARLHDAEASWGKEGRSIVAEVAQRDLHGDTFRRVKALLRGAISLAPITRWADHFPSVPREISAWHFVDNGRGFFPFDLQPHEEPFSGMYTPGLLAAIGKPTAGGDSRQATFMNSVALRKRDIDYHINFDERGAYSRFASEGECCRQRVRGWRNATSGGTHMARSSVWPSLQQQLDAVKPPRDSNLEKLIKDNQDFDLLHAEEAHDDAGLPLWLRVFWRKNHPDVPHPTVNPGAGYPDVLYNIHTWMLSHPDLPWGSPSDPTRTRGR
jgi:hypothetical protein